LNLPREKFELFFKKVQPCQDTGIYPSMAGPYKSGRRMKRKGRKTWIPAFALRVWFH